MSDKLGSISRTVDTRRLSGYAFVAALTALSILVPDAASAQSAAEILEQARGRGRDFEELKAVLNGPDANMRLATFEVMSKSDDETIRAIALDVGLASADSLLQELAFKHAIMGLDRLHLEISPDPAQDRSTLELAKAYVASKGGVLIIGLGWKDPESGTFRMKKNDPRFAGEVAGSIVTFSYHLVSGTLSLHGEDSIRGTVRARHSAKVVSLIATMKIR